MLPQFVNEGMYIPLRENIPHRGNSVLILFISSERLEILSNSQQSFNRNILTHLYLKSKTFTYEQNAITLSKVKPN